MYAALPESERLKSGLDLSGYAGQSVRIDLIRGGSPISITVQLNPASPSPKED